MKIYFLTILLLSIFISIKSQDQKVLIEKSNSNIKLIIPEIKTVPEDSDTCSTCLKPYGKKYQVNLNLREWNILQKNDTTVYSIEIAAKGALYLDISLMNLIIPKGSLLVITDNKELTREYDYKHTLRSEKFKIYTCSGDKAVLQFMVPNVVQINSQIELASVVYIFKDIFAHEEINTEKELSCHNDINCPDALHYRGLTQSVVHIRELCDNDDNCYICSGSVINNVRRDNTPYILTANHCINGGVMDNLDETVFVFNYNSNGCDGNSLYIADYELVGANLRAHLHGTVGSDFALLELSDEIPLQFNVLWAGWDRANGSELQGQDVIGIHHPDGSFKRISYGEIDNNLAPIIGFIRVEWDDGLVEGGSSGSPLFTEDFRIVGQLGGGPFAGNCSNLGSDYYGHFKESWSSIWGADNRLKDWLDPDDEDPDHISGYLPIWECPTNRTLSGEYYRTDYHPDYVVTVGASSTLTLTDLTVFENGNYEFRSGNIIELLSDVEFQLGSTIEFITSSCHP